MTQEEKQLLLKDLCARLPYGVICEDVYGNSGLLFDLTPDLNAITLKISKLGSTWTTDIDKVKPYLRPMSSMTEEEKTQVQMFIDIVTNENYGDGYSPSAWDAMNGFVQYCDSHHLDHRGMIFRGLALKALEGMY